MDTTSQHDVPTFLDRYADALTGQLGIQVVIDTTPAQP